MKKVYLISPSCLMERKQDFSRGIDQLSTLGFKVINPDFPKKLPSPEEKANQIHGAFNNPEVDIILAIRGGYGAMKSLPFINFELIKKRPKIIAGFSDFCALLNPIFEHTGTVTFHAPMVINLESPNEFTMKSFLDAFNGFTQKNLFKGVRVKTYHAGSAIGILKGGNLITLTALIKTKWDIDTSGAILFLEDVDEKLHEVDRCFTQWILAGKLKGIRALILGNFKGINSQKIYDILTSQMIIDFPVIYCPNIGHVEKKLTLPIGAVVELDTDQKHLVIRKMSFPGQLQ